MDHVEPANLNVISDRDKSSLLIPLRRMVLGVSRSDGWFETARELRMCSFMEEEELRE